MSEVSPSLKEPVARLGISDGGQDMSFLGYYVHLNAIGVSCWWCNKFTLFRNVCKHFTLTSMCYTSRSARLAEGDLLLNI